MKTNRRVLPWMFVSLLVVPACDSVDNTDNDNGNGGKHYAHDTFSHELAAADESILRLEGVNGKIEITGKPGAPSIVVSGTKRVGSDTYIDAENRLDDVQVSVDRAGNEILVRTHQPQFSNGRNYEVNYDITVPTKLMVSIRSVNGSVLVSGTSGASVALINGDITSDGPLPDSGSLDLKTTNGSISLRIPKSTSARLRASVVNGRVTSSNLPLNGSSPGSARSLDVTLGNGSGQIVLSTTNGNIKVAGY